ncbi:bifunctional Tetratricopeptide-like helical domain superfamily/Tetratricopeptide repeat protein TTC27-Emw1/Tetratricopeptide repeat [Babesia duncani]|uniref:Bifunctional Tetratricopeptide-like helical domain superfamily/Tetratricopeptide repeat protein TTC27-Emw1/Tetratricopeptide repeat n=1 Tax=Babesia duncani TaxID=323732 RepID=A0AAD9PM30_9APIC|nr:bifunctional Tetratricopeptide-like helical domain superfamily/Tetratricopeptide repeat protein TTC27-Emw1/Tetratricopeptide repeat [Babesia duncani]
MEVKESHDLWALELCLLHQEEITKECLINKFSIVDRSRIKALVLFIGHVNNVELFEGILHFERELGKPTLLTKINENEVFVDSKALFRYLVNASREYMNNNAEDAFTNVYILGISCLLLNIFIRANWTGPPLTVLSDSDKLLAESYKNKAVQNDIDDDVSLDGLLLSCNETNAFTAFAKEKLSNEYIQRCVLGSPDVSSFDLKFNESQFSILTKSILDDLSLQGEVIYPGVKGIAYFFASVAFLSTLTDDSGVKNNINVKSKLKSIGIWQCRQAFVWQRIIQDAMHSPCSFLMKVSVIEFVDLLKYSNILNADFDCSICEKDILKQVVLIPEDKNQYCPSENQIAQSLLSVQKAQLDVDNNMKALFLTELLQRLPYYNMNKLFEKLLESACDYIGFHFTFTGKLGIRRKYQTRSLPQLVVATSGNVNSKSSQENLGSGQAGPACIDLSCIDNQTDLLEAPKLESQETSKILCGTEQVLLLARGLNIINSIPVGDELGLQYANAIVVKCLESSKVQQYWLLTSLALWIRCKTEYHRTKTVERATLQLHSIHDGFFEHNVKASEKLKYFWGCCYPTGWEIQIEIAKRMLKIGSFMTAFEIYNKLKMYEYASECLIMTNRLQDAKKYVMSMLKEYPTPMLWCHLGDIENKIEHYETAWNLSKNTCARAQRAMGAYYFKLADFSKSVECLECALSINPMRESSLFLLGCCFLKLNKMEPAISAFARVVSIDSESCDAWANMCSAHLSLKNYKQAKICIEQALKVNTGKWQLWDILLRISVTTRDVSSVCRAINNIISLGQKANIEPWVFAFLVDSIISNRLTESIENIVTKTMENITKEITDNAEIWNLYAKYHSFQKNYVTAYEATLKEYRKIVEAIEINLTRVQADDDAQLEYDVKQLKRLTNCLGGLIVLLKRMTPAQRMERRESLVTTLEAIKSRIKVRTCNVQEQFIKELDDFIESANVEDIIIVND